MKASFSEDDCVALISTFHDIHNADETPKATPHKTSLHPISAFAALQLWKKHLCRFSTHYLPNS